MKLSIITEQLSKKLPQENYLQKLTVVKPQEFESIYKLLYGKDIEELNITDVTCSQKMESGSTVGVKDHINKTGSNPLIGKQALLDIDFIDMTGNYSLKKNAITTVCCGKTLNTNYVYPSHFLCHITTLARALKIPQIKGILYNII